MVKLLHCINMISITPLWRTRAKKGFIRVRCQKYLSGTIWLAAAVALDPEIAKAADDNSGVVTVVLIIGVLFVLIYFIPTIVAFRKSHPNRWVILALNVFLGTTGIVWIICLIWAMKAIHMSESRAGSDGGEVRAKHFCQ